MLVSTCSSVGRGRFYTHGTVGSDVLIKRPASEVGGSAGGGDEGWWVRGGVGWETYALTSTKTDGLLLMLLNMKLRIRSDQWPAVWTVFMWCWSDMIVVNNSHEKVKDLMKHVYGVRWFSHFRWLLWYHVTKLSQSASESATLLVCWDNHKLVILFQCGMSGRTLFLRLICLWGLEMSCSFSSFKVVKKKEVVLSCDGLQAHFLFYCNILYKLISHFRWVIEWAAEILQNVFLIFISVKY